jgi:hypothetical protein
VEASLKKTRRIEITAFRRTVTVSARGPTAGPGEAADHRLGSTPCSEDRTPPHLRQADLVDAVLASIVDTRTPVAEHVIEAMMGSNADSAHNAEQTALAPNKVCSLLRSLGSPVIRLQALLDGLRKHGSLKAAKKSCCGSYLKGGNKR